jgi:2-phospho-L-lactate guanylyltransferase
MRTAAVLPVKRFARAKQRLGPSVADTRRLKLARAMVADVLFALAETETIERVVVVTNEPSVAAAGGRGGALIVADPAEESQSAAVKLGVRRALEGGIERVLCIPGDCPALDPADLDSLLGAPAEEPRDSQGRPARGGQVVIVPDRHGTGTNGLLLTPPDAIAPSFGPDSCERHRALALAAGIACRVERPSSLLLDIDTGEDLEVLRMRLVAEARTSATRTRRLLGAGESGPAPSITALA